MKLTAAQLTTLKADLPIMPTDDTDERWYLVWDRIIFWGFVAIGAAMACGWLQ